MVLLAGQYDAGGLGRASLHRDPNAVSKLSFGGSAGLNMIPSASTIARTDSSVTGHSPVWSTCRATGRLPRRCSTSFMSIAAQDEAPSVKPNWNAVMRSKADPCSSSPV